MESDLNGVIRTLQISSVHLTKFEKGNVTPYGGSGCLVSFGGNRFLLTVDHVLKTRESHLLIKWDPAKRETLTRQFNASAAHKIAECSLEGVREITDLDDLDMKKVDAAFFEYRYEHPECQDIAPTGEVFESRPCTIYLEAKLVHPREGVAYGFGGLTAGRLGTAMVDGRELQTRTSQFRWAYEMTFKGKFGDFYGFRLPGPHPGRGYYKGCSGSPIVDMEGNVVALVANGSPSQAMLYGIPIEKYLNSVMGYYLKKRFEETGEHLLPEDLRRLFGACDQ